MLIVCKLVVVVVVVVVVRRRWRMKLLFEVRKSGKRGVIDA